jgi:hypothetical protein
MPDGTKYPPGTVNLPGVVTAEQRRLLEAQWREARIIPGNSTYHIGNIVIPGIQPLATIVHSNINLSPEVDFVVNYWTSFDPNLLNAAFSPTKVNSPYIDNASLLEDVEIKSTLTNMRRLDLVNKSWQEAVVELKRLLLRLKLSSYMSYPLDGITLDIGEDRSIGSGTSRTPERWLYTGYFKLLVRNRNVLTGKTKEERLTSSTQLLRQIGVELSPGSRGMVDQETRELLRAI